MSDAEGNREPITEIDLWAKTSRKIRAEPGRFMNNKNVSLAEAEWGKRRVVRNEVRQWAFTPSLTKPLEDLKQICDRIWLFFIKCCFETTVGDGAWNRRRRNVSYGNRFTVNFALELHLIFKYVKYVHATKTFCLASFLRKGYMVRSPFSPLLARAMQLTFPEAIFL